MFLFAVFEEAEGIDQNEIGGGRCHVGFVVTFTSLLIRVLMSLRILVAIYLCE